MLEQKALLVAMPWASSLIPSIQLGALKAYLSAKGLRCDAEYASLLLADRLGPRLYNSISEMGLLSELFFAPSFNGTRSVSAQQLLARRFSATELDRVEQVIEQFLDDLWQRTAWESYTAVGFTTTFSQLMASLSLARRIKRHFPNKLIIFGGTQAYGAMGDSLLEHFDCIDLVVDGEGEETLAELLQAGPRPQLGAIRGIRYRHNGRVVASAPRPLLSTLAELPPPDFSDYFRCLEALENFRPIPVLPVEGSRGCWWNRCTFCGLNAGFQPYRAKSPEQLEREILHHTERYEVLNFTLVDTLIDYQTLDETFSRLKELRQRFDLSFTMEVYARLTKQQIHTMAEAGVTHILVGVESLNTGILKRMRKGTTALQNLQCLKWCIEADIQVNYNIITEFPTEGEAELADLLKLMGKVRHLPPPDASPFVLERNSPIFNSLAQYGIRSIKPSPIYYHLFPDKPVDAMNLLYYEYTCDTPESLQALRREVLKEIGEWQDQYDGRRVPDLVYRDGSSFLEFCDKRSSAPLQLHLNSLLRELYLFCDSCKSLAQVCRRFDFLPRCCGPSSR